MWQTRREKLKTYKTSDKRSQTSKKKVTKSDKLV